MADSLILTLAILFIPIIASRYIMENALKKLDSDSKIKLLDAFSNQRKYASLIIFPVMIAYFLVLKYFPDYYMQTVSITGSLFLIWYIFSRTSHIKKMQALEISADYINKYKLSMVLVLLGFIGVGIEIFYLWSE